MLPGISEVSQTADRFCHLQLRAELGGQLSRKLAAIECVYCYAHFTRGWNVLSRSSSYVCLYPLLLFIYAVGSPHAN